MEKAAERREERRGHIFLPSEVRSNMCVAADSEISALMWVHSVDVR